MNTVTNKSLKRIRVHSQSTHAFKEQMRIGAGIANCLPKIMPANVVAKMEGISETMLRQIECRALYKVRCRLLEIHQTYLKSLNE